MVTNRYKGIYVIVAQRMRHQRNLVQGVNNILPLWIHIVAVFSTLVLFGALTFIIGMSAMEKMKTPGTVRS